MKLTSLDDQVSVSDQIDVTDVPELQRLGVNTVVCNRPDSEAADQPAFGAIAAACKKLGLQCHHLPFVGDALSEEDVAGFADLLRDGQRVHAYCRSGARSSKLWASTRHRQGIDAVELLTRAGQAGFDVSKQVQS